MGDLGARLCSRETAGIPVRQLSSRTKIKESILDAIEHEDFTKVPTGPFRRGFLRAVAHETGLDPEAIVFEYTIEFEPQPEPLPANPIQTPHFPNVEAGSGSRGTRLSAMVLIAAVVVVTVVLFLVVVLFLFDTGLDRPQSDVPTVTAAGDREAEEPISYLRDASTPA